MPELQVAIDSRMLQHSGIGVFLRSVFAQWERKPPPFRIAMVGDYPVMSEWSRRLEAPMYPWRADIYSVVTALSRPRLKGFSAWYSPHFATSLRPGCPLVCHVQDILHITHPPRKGTAMPARAYFAMLKQRASMVLTTTRHVKVQIQTLLRFDAARVLCSGAGPGIAEGPIAPVEDLPEPMRRNPYAMAVGIHRPHKNWTFLLNQWKRVESGEALACITTRLDHAGLEREVQRLGLRHRAFVLSDLPEPVMRAAYRHARALMYPSLAEGFGLPLLEAMKLGTPVVAANRSPMKEIAGAAGFLYDPDYVDTFHAAVRAALGDEQERAARVEIGLRLAERYSWETTTRIVEDAIMRAATGDLPAPIPAEPLYETTGRA